MLKLLNLPDSQYKIPRHFAYNYFAKIDNINN